MFSFKDNAQGEARREFQLIQGDSYGDKYAVPPGTPAESVSPPPWTDRTQYKEYEVIKPIPNVTQSSATPWGGDPGLGTQYELPTTIEQLLREGYIKPKE